jgi:protein PhnA
MTILDTLQTRADNKCELCSSLENLAAFEVPPNSDGSTEQSVLLCSSCREQIKYPDKTDANHWRCLNDSMWNQEPAVQVLAWRMLTRLNGEGWAQNLLDMLYLDEAVLAWAQAEGAVSDDDTVKHMDANGTQLAAGDTVTLIKDLVVKGAGFTAKRGTSVRGISLVTDNEKHIEGRVNNQQIVILTEFVKKSG